MGVGTGIGAGIKGYYGAKKLRNESEATDAEMKIQELEDEIRRYEQADKIAAIPETYDQNRHNAELERRRRRGQIYDADQELPRAQRKESGAVRGEETAVAGHPGDLEVARNRLPNEQRSEAIKVKKQPGLEADAENELNRANRKETREEQVAKQETTQYETQQIVQSIPDLEAAFEASGHNGAVLDDWYEEYMPNGHTVTTRDDPDVPGGYILTDNQGNERKAASAEELMAKFKQTFTNPAMIDKMLGRGNLGRLPGQYRPDVGGIRQGGYGVGGMGGGTFKDRFFQPTYDALKAQNPDMPAHELHLMTLERLSERGAVGDKAFLREAKLNMLEMIMRERPDKQAALIKRMNELFDGFGLPDLYEEQQSVGKTVDDLYGEVQ